jgi:hypothetical protein
MRTAFLALILLAAGCAGPATPPAAAPSAAAPGAASSKPRVITAVGSEIDTLPTRIQVGGGTYAGDFNYLVNSPFSIQNAQGQVLANLAAELPSQDNGSWVVNADGTMETTWKIPVRKGLVGPGARWPGQTGNTWNASQWYWE